MEIHAPVALHKKLVFSLALFLVFLLTSLFINKSPVFAYVPCDGGAVCGGRCVDILSDGNNCGDCGVHCDQGTSCTGGACSTQDTGGATCNGCQPGNAGWSGLGLINNVWITDKTASSFTVNWTRDSGGCGNKSDNVVFIGTDKDVVESNCFNCGAGTPGGGNPTPDCGDKDYGSSNLPAGCLAERVIPDINTSSLNTASSGISLDPSKTYYAKVVGWVHFTKVLASGAEEDTNVICEGYNAEPFLGFCSTNSVPPGAQMSVGAPPQLFQTAIDAEKNTISYNGPVPTRFEFPTEKQCNDDGCSFVRTGLNIFGYRFGTGKVRVTIHTSPVVQGPFYTTVRVCNDEGRVCRPVVNGEDFGIIPPGPGPVDVYINGVFYQQVSGSSFHITCTIDTCPPASAITLSPYIAYDNLVQVTNSPYFGSITTDSVNIPGFVWDFTSYEVTYSEGNNIPPSPFYAIANVGYTPSSDSPPYISIDTGLNPNPDPTEPYQVYVSALRSTYPGITNLTTNVYATGVASPPACTSDTPLAIGEALQLDSWWQVKDSDVQSSANISSSVPSGNFFGLFGDGGYPGVPASSSNSFGSGEASDTYNWQVEGAMTNPRSFYYSDFVNLIPSDTQISEIPAGTTSIDDNTFADASTTGYSWYKYSGADTGVPLSVDSPINIGSKRVILLVDKADLNINSTINLTDGAGFFMVIVNGKIVVNPSVGGGGVPDLEGLFVSDGTFSDGSLLTDNPEAEDSQLIIRGSVAAYGGVQLDRDLVSGNTEPAELFEYAPDQIMLYPTALGYRKIKWEEVAP